MERKVLIAAGAALLVLAGLLAFFGAQITGLVPAEVVIGDEVALPSSSVERCCVFADADGRTRACGVIAPYGCEFCEEYCG